VKKTIINPSIGKGWHYFEGSGVTELVHSGAVVVETDDLKFVYLSGRTAVTSDEDETIVGEGDIKEQTRQILRLLQKPLAEAGGTLDDVVRMRVFVQPGMTRQMFAQIHEARAEFFNKEHYPASTLVMVHALARPGAMLEIDADAVIAKKK
jgi:enamine deaminase RidA (YjgF/YER057c/UK114 family)